MVKRRGATRLVVAAFALMAAGCSVLLDPDNCSDDSECNGGVCQDGICVGGAIGPDSAEPEPDNMVAPPDMAPDVAADMAIDLGPDAEVDMAPDAAPPEPLAPTCTLAATPDGEGPTTADEVSLSIGIADPDSPLAELTVTLDGQPLAIDGDSAVEVRPLVEGRNAFALRVEDPEGLRCDAAVAIVRDASGPVIEGLTPPAGADLLTGNAQFPISGRVVDAHFDPTGAAGLRIEVGGASVEPTIDWNGGAFAFEVTLDEGPNVLSLTAVDDLGNRSATAEVTVRLDATPPVVLVDAPLADAEVFDDRVAVRGRVQDDRQPVPNASFAIRIQAAGQNPVRIDGLADAGGAFNRIIPLFDGANTLTVSAQDMAGNTGQVVRTVTRLPANPCVTITGPVDGAFTRVARIDVAGDVCPAVDRVEVQVGAGPPVQVAPRDERFQATLDLPGPGAHVITATAFAANGEAADTVRVVLDDSPPSIDFSEPSPGQCTNVRDLRVCGRVSDPQSGIASVSLFASDEETVVALPPEGGPFCETVRVREGDDIRIIAQARNRALGQAEATVAIRVDRTDPTLCIVRNGQCLQSAQRPWFGLDQAGRVVFEGQATWGTCAISSLRVDGAAVNVGMDGRFSAARPFADGPQAIEMVVRDTAGNMPPPVPFVFRVDGTPPVLDAVSPGQDIFTTEAQIRLEVELRDAGSGLVSISIGGQQVFAAPAGQNQGSANEIAARVVALVEGLNTFQVVAVDLVGNRRVETVTVRRDTRAPVVTIESPEPGRPAPIPTVVIGTIDDGPDGSGPDVVTVNGVVAQIDAATGTWRADDVPLDLAEPSLLVEATDALGNAAAPLVQPVAVADFGTHDPAIDGLGFVGAIGWVGVIDVDLDGQLDVVALGGAADVASMVYRQVAPGRFVAAGAADVGLPEGMVVRHAAVADLDANGTQDLVIVGVGRTAIALGTGAGGFRLVENPRIPGSAAPTGIALGDITRNARLDLVVMAGAATRLYLSAGDGSFDREPLDNLGLASLTGHRAARLVDIDDDGVLDLVAVGPAGAGLWLGDRIGPFTPAPVGIGFVQAPAAVILPFDANRDGALDVVTLGPDGGRFMLADGQGGFTEDAGGIGLWPADVAALDRLDFDGDTRDDMVGWGGALHIWRGSADGFEAIDALAAGADAGGPATVLAVADLDGDGDDDLLTGGPGGLRFIRSNRAATDLDYSAIGLDVRRSLAPPAAPGPRDGWGARIDVDLIGGDDGQPERTLLARPVGPTVVTVGPVDSVGVAVNYVDLGGVGQSIRNLVGLLPGIVTEVYAREAQ